MQRLTCLELCAGAGGQAIGLEKAGFGHLALVDLDEHCCQTLRYNRPKWDVLQGDIRDLGGILGKYGTPDLIAAGLPCPPFSVAGKQLGSTDERDLFPAALRIIKKMQPRAIMIENVRGFLSPSFVDYRANITRRLRGMGYASAMRLLNASDFGVPQLRPRVVIVALHHNAFERFVWPEPQESPARTVGESLFDLMTAQGWDGASAWRLAANAVAPTIVGGSKKHGGPDLGPTRARTAWAALGVNGNTIAEEAPHPGFHGMPRLTVQMVARLQGFPDEWRFSGAKTAAYRQVGNAFPPPVACAVAKQIFAALSSARRSQTAI